MTIDSLLGGGYLLSHFRSTIGVVRLNFSVRNGKRWDPHALTTLLSFGPNGASCMCRGRDGLKRPSGERITAKTILATLIALIALGFLERVPASYIFRSPPSPSTGRGQRTRKLSGD